MNFTYDGFNQMETPKIYLVSQDNESKVPINAKNISVSLNGAETSVVEFDVDEYINGIKNESYDLIEGLRTIYVSNLGDENRSYFQINTPKEVGEELNSYKSCRGQTLEYQLSQKDITYLVVNMGTLGSLDGVVLHDVNDPELSLLDLVLDNTGWSVGDVDSSISNLQRSFEIDKQDIYNFLVGDVAKAYSCVFTFDTVNKKVNATAVENIGMDTDIHISLHNLAKRIEITSDEDSIFTKFYVEGYDGLDIRAVNLGSDYIIDYSYYATPEWLGSQETVNKYNNYLNVRESARLEYIDEYKTYMDLITQYFELNNRVPDNPDSMDWIEYGLIELQTMESAYQNVVNAQVEAGQDDSQHINHPAYEANLNVLNEIKAEIIIREAEVANVNIQINHSNDKMIGLVSSVELDLFFTPEELSVFKSLEINADYKDDTFVVTESMTDIQRLEIQQDLYDSATIETSKLSQPQYYFRTEMNNLFTIPEFREVSDDFDLFSFITLTLRDDYHVRLRLMNINIDFDNLDSLTVEFSNTVKSRDELNDFMDLVGNTISSATGSISRKINSNLSKVESDVVDLEERVNGEFTVDRLLARQAFFDTQKAIVSASEAYEYTDSVIAINGGNRVFRGTTQPKSTLEKPLKENDVWYRENTTTDANGVEINVVDMHVYDGANWQLKANNASNLGGTLDASYLNLINLNANNITSGNIHLDRGLTVVNNGVDVLKVANGNVEMNVDNLLIQGSSLESEMDTAFYKNANAIGLTATDEDGNIASIIQTGTDGTVYIGGSNIMLDGNTVVGSDFSVSWDKVSGRPNTTYIDADGLYTGTVMANQIEANNLSAITGHLGNVTVGGANNIDGVLKIKDASSNDIVVMNSSGIELSNGAKLIGNGGVLSVFQYVSSGSGFLSGLSTHGWEHTGIMGSPWEGWRRNTVGIRVSIPSNFTITKADILIGHMPIYVMWENSSNAALKRWKQGRNFKLYKATSNDGFCLYSMATSFAGIGWLNNTDITSSTFGVSSWTPSLAYSGTDANNRQNKIQYRSGNLASQLTPGQVSTFYIETTDATTEANYAVNECLTQIIITVEGYKY